ncbi:MAG: epoxyqueuosine reductase QueH [Nitrospirae bacterium]|nr:epoxyqueuosine reductase QueH [Nitrospirota bacterium]
MKILMHICCSNCSIHPLQNLLLKGMDIKGFWFNPNIHPYTEYTARLDSVSKLGRLWNLDIEYDDDYCLDDFLKSVAGKGPDRCAVCYEKRLDRTAQAAKKMYFDGFTTSLLVSPYQKFDAILEQGKKAATRYGVSFFAEDFRPGWKTSQNMSRELALYRQKYCGCIYSEMERYTQGGKRRNNQTP